MCSRNMLWPSSQIFFLKHKLNQSIFHEHINQASSRPAHFEAAELHREGLLILLQRRRVQDRHIAWDRHFGESQGNTERAEGHWTWPKISHH